MSLLQNASPISLLIRTNKVKPVYFYTVIILLASLLLAISSQFKVPLGPVPVTLQSLVVMLIGTLFGWRLAGATVIAYWVEGIIIGGLFSFMPWFANGSGLLYFLTSPSSGFLWGFLPMVLFVGFSMKLLVKEDIKNNVFYNLFVISAILLVSQVVLYIFGIAHAYFIILPTVDWMNSFDELIAIYLTPFIIGDVLKTLLAVLITYKIMTYLGKKLTKI